MANEQTTYYKEENAPLERRFQLLEHGFECLRDQVWWIGLPFYRRWFYRLQGFRAPIERFYEKVKE